MASRAESKISTDHDEIRRWAEARGGQPACVKGTGDPGDVGMLRIDFPGFSGEESLQHISWDDWFEKFDERNLALLHQEMTAGGAQSNFNKLISRPQEPAQGSARKAAKRTSAKNGAGNRTANKNAGGRNAAANRSGGRSTGAKKAVAKKASAKKASAKKAAGKKAPAKKAVAKKGTKAVAKKAQKKAAKKTAAKRRR